MAPAQSQYNPENEAELNPQREPPYTTVYGGFRLPLYCPQGTEAFSHARIALQKCAVHEYI